jgi:Tol biopolymer transport system component
VTRRVAASAAGLAMLVALLVGPASAARGELVLVSRASGLTGLSADAESFNPSVSRDGRLVAFASHADNLSTIDNDAVSNVFIRDVVTGTTTLVSEVEGVAGDGDSLNPSISSDGRFVAFQSAATNFSSIDQDAVVDVFVRNLETGSITVVSQANGVGGDATSQQPSISADGRLIAFSSLADNLAGGASGVFDIFLRNSGENTTTLMSHNGFFGAGDDTSLDPSISADGRSVAFASNADNLNFIDDNAVTNVFVRNLQSGALTLVSQAGGVGGDGNSGGPTISGDGRVVVFTSVATNLSALDDDSEDVFARDLDVGTTTLVSEANGVGGDSTSTQPSISADGRFVAFTSQARNLAGGGDPFQDIFVRDLQALAPTLVSEVNGAAADGSSLEPAFSADGRFVVFRSGADNLSTDDSNAVSNVFRRDVRGGPPVCSDIAQVVAPAGATTLALTCADLDGDAISRVIVGQPAHGTLGPVDQASGTVAYTPLRGFAGADTFRFQASDATGASNVATASVSLAPATQPPAPAPAPAPAFGSRTLVSLRLAATRIPLRGPVRVVVANANDFAVSGTVSGRAVGPRRDRLATKRFRAGARRAATVALALPRPLRRLLARKGRLTVRLSARVVDPAENARKLTKNVQPRRRR